MIHLCDRVMDGTVDAVYAMAHALHQNIKQKCGTMDFKECDALQPAPFGADLLRSIREASFVGMQGTQVIVRLKINVLNHIKSMNALFNLLVLSLLFRFDSIRTAMHMDIIIFININDMAKNLITFKLAHGKKRNYPNYPYLCNIKEKFTNIFYLAFSVWICNMMYFVGRVALDRQNQFVVIHVRLDMCTIIRISVVGRV